MAYAMDIAVGKPGEIYIISKDYPVDSTACGNVYYKTAANTANGSNDEPDGKTFVLKDTRSDIECGTGVAIESVSSSTSAFVVHLLNTYIYYWDTDKWTKYA